MSDITLSDGREIDFDFSDLTISEFRSIRDPYEPDYKSDELLARVSGLTVEEVENMKFLEFRRFIKRFYQVAYLPDPDKN